MSAAYTCKVVVVFDWSTNRFILGNRNRRQAFANFYARLWVSEYL